MLTEGDKLLAVIVEDDRDVRSLIESILTQAGFEVIVTSNGADGVDAVRRHDPALTTLDVSMSGMDGFATAKNIREFSSTYLIMITALGEEIDVVQGLDSGADDYLVKPFRPRELRARISSMLRRPRARTTSGDLTEAAPAAPSAPSAAGAVTMTKALVARTGVIVKSHDHRDRDENVHDVLVEPEVRTDGDKWLRYKGIELNPSTRIVLVDERGVDLTRTEFDLMQTLISSGRRVRSKADLTLALRGETYVTSYLVTDADKRAVEVHVANLRRKLGDNSSTPRWIETVRGVGYRVAAAD